MIRPCIKKIPAAVAGAALLCTGMATPVLAQSVLEEVVVTARKREESIQDVPLAVSAISRDSVEAAFLMDATAISQFAPNLIFDNISAGTPGAGGISIRGISFQDVEKTFDPAVLMYIDDIALGTNSGNAMSMLDVERIEVLRGPQGTLFGKNAVGGVIHIHRIKPIIGELAGKARARVGNYGRRDVEGVLNVPLAENLAAKFTVARLEQDDGFYKNITQNRRDGDNKEERFGVHFLWEPLPTVTSEFQYNQSDMEGTVDPMMSINSELADLCSGFGVCAESANRPYSGDRREGAGGLLQDYYLDTKDYTFKTSWDMTDDVTAVLIYGHREIEDGQAVDYDDSPMNLFHAIRSSEYEQDSLELRFDYDAGEALSFTSGYYYWKGKTDNWMNETMLPLFLGLPEDGCGTPIGQPACQIDYAKAESKSHSFYLEGDYRLTERWIATLGARWIKEEKSLSKRGEMPIFDMVSLAPMSADRKDIDTIYRAGLRYEHSDDLMGYVTYSTGFRSGGFSIRANTLEVLQDGYDPEELRNLEVGFKATLLDGRLRVNGAVFDMEYKNMQQELNIAGGPTGQQDTVVNASKATIRGAELEIDALLTDTLRVDLNIGYLDAEYDNFMGSLFTDGVVRDLSYLPLRRAPQWNYTLGLNYSEQVGPGELMGRVSYDWRDDYATSASNFPGTQVSSFGLLDASLTYRLNAWQVAVYARNLTNEDEYNHPFVVAPGYDGSSLFTFATPRAPRTFGMEVTYTFNDY